VVTECRAGEALVAVFVRSLFPHKAKAPAGLDALVVGLLVDETGTMMGARLHEVVRHRRAVEAAVDQQRALAVGLHAELVVLVVHDE
jgi:hypothetical protein